MFATVTINPLTRPVKYHWRGKIGWWGGALERGYTPSSPATARRPTASTRHAPIPRGQRRRAPSGGRWRKAEAEPREVSAVFAHAAGTQAGDAAEVRALDAALGEALGDVPVTAMKSMTGAHAGRIGGRASSGGGQGHRLGNRASNHQLRAPRRRPVDRLRAGRSAPRASAARAVQLLWLWGAERGAGVLGAWAIDANGAAEAALSLPREAGGRPQGTPLQEAARAGRVWRRAL